MFQIKFTTTVPSQPILAGLKAGIRNRVLRSAVTKAARLVKKDIKAAAPVDSGAMRASIDQKIITKNDRVTAVIGPRKDYVKQVGSQERKPVKYTHIFEFGSKKQEAQPFVSPTWESHRADYMAKMQDVITQEISKLLK